MLLNLMDANNLVPGKRGQAMRFDGSSQYLSHTAIEDKGLPISRAHSYSILLWVKAKGTGQSDRRVFSEGSTLSNNPLVNIGTHNTGADDTVDIFIRNPGTVRINHLHSKAAGYDNAWHHIAWTDANGQGKLYIDGVLDSTANYTRGTDPVDTTSIGAILRAAPGSYFAGDVDEVALWERVLSAEEIQEVMNNGIQTPVPPFAPAITGHPTGASNLLIGDAYTMRAAAIGTRPISYEWLKNDALIAGQTANALALTGLSQADSGTYKAVAKNAIGSTTSDGAVLVVNPIPAPNLTNGMVAYWPLDEVLGIKTPDLVSGYDMELENLTAADLVAGKWGKAMSFDNGRKTLLKRIDQPGEDLPIYQHPDFSVSLWVNGASGQVDRRVFSEGSTKSTQQLFNIGTHSSGADGTVDSYIRSDTGGTGGHRYSIATAFDSTWRHIAYVQRDIGGTMIGTFYIDGVKDDGALNPVRPLTLDTTTIGGILRASASAWFTGWIDDVAVWNRALTAAEAQQLATQVTPTPPSKLQPLAINSFKPDRPAVAVGGSVILRWDVSKDASLVAIDSGVGDVTSQTVAGAGNQSVTLTTTTTFRLTIKRGTEELSATTRVTVIDGVAPNWVLVDNFDRYNVGPLSQTGWWQDLRGDFAQVEDLNGNRMLSIRSSDSAAVLPLRTLTFKEGQKATLFFRLIPRGAPALQHIVGLTDKNIRTYGDSSSNIGPVVYPTYDSASSAWKLGARYGVGAAVDLSGDPLETGAVYAVWIDMENVAMTSPLPEDIYTVYIQKEGAASRTELFPNYLSDRDLFNPDPILGGASPDLDKLFVSGNNTTESAWFDDFYLSQGGYLSTVPRAFGFSAPVGGAPPQMSISRLAGQVEIIWTGGTLESAPAITGPWSAVAGAAAPPYRTAPEGAQMYFRARQ
ncbi:MAG: hypothetical protein FJ387_03495 [Verrucomicrobia bacterium]|nr:hypothetical protein [Verrucomicrobiota bacterium]